MEKLLNNIERTQLILVDLEQLYILQQRMLNEHASKLEIFYHDFSTTDQEITRFETRLNEWFGVDWQKKT